jgi:hypothetical protein
MIPLDPKRPLKLEEPNPYPAGAAFLAWLSKQGQEADLSDCLDKWDLHNRNKPTKELEKFNLDDFIKYLGPELIIKGRRPYGEIVKLTPKGVDWAAEWAIEYKVQRWHHGTQIPKKY